MSQGDFLASLLLLNKEQSTRTQEQFVDRLSHLGRQLREILDRNALVGRFAYRPTEYWPHTHGQTFAFVDGGVANIELPSAAPIGIRVGTYTVRPGDDSEERERFDVQLSLVDDLFSDEGYLYDADLPDVAKLRDAARIISELSGVYRLALARPRPHAILLHGPLINPAAPYGADDFPSFSVDAARMLLAEPTWDGSIDDRRFVSLYLRLLNKLRDTQCTVAGTVERSIGRDPVVIRRLLQGLCSRDKLSEAVSKAYLNDLRAFGLNDSSLLDVVLEEGEYLKPIPVNRQGPEHKWPKFWEKTIERYPSAHTTYIKPSAAVTPFRVEFFDSTPNQDGVLDLLLHTSRLLPRYGFPVGLDIADKFVKVPAWMSKGVQGQYQVVLLQKALATGDQRTIAFAKRVLAARGRDWLFRPTAL